MTDPLSDVLRSVQLAGAAFFALDAASDSSGCASVGFASLLAAGAEHVIEYHVVTEGVAWAGPAGERAVRLEAGDVLVLPHGDRQLQLAGDEDARIVCGFLGCDARPFSPLLATLPGLLHLPGGSRANSISRRLVELAVAESTANRAGGDCMLCRLGELLFAEVVRQQVAALPPETTGWLAGLRDLGIGRALQKLHERPAHSWSLEELAKEAGMSRSTLAERFGFIVGTPPMHYLAQWRIQLAASLLRRSKSSLAEIADRVGYGSEAALSRAFKRSLGVSPTPYRRGEPMWRKAS